MFEYRGYVGLDIHKETIATAVAWPGPGGAGVPGHPPEPPQVAEQTHQHPSGDAGRGPELRL